MRDYETTNSIQAGSYSQAEPAPPSLTSDISRRLDNLAMLVGDTGGNLVSLSDRLFGAVPRPAGGAASNAAKPAGQGGELVAILDNLIERASYALEESRNLNSRI